MAWEWNIKQIHFIVVRKFIKEIIMLKEDVLNIDIRKFLKNVGITCQREIEKSVRNAVDNSNIETNQTLSATVVLEIPSVKLKYTIDGQIRFE